MLTKQKGTKARLLTATRHSKEKHRKLGRSFRCLNDALKKIGSLLAAVPNGTCCFFSINFGKKYYKICRLRLGIIYQYCKNKRDSQSINMCNILENTFHSPAYVNVDMLYCRGAISKTADDILHYLIYSKSKQKCVFRSAAIILSLLKNICSFNLHCLEN